MEYRVQLPVYEGPLDLLLFLIQKDELDIFDIPIAYITEQYLSYLDLMRELELAVAGEFFVMAATLMEIKSAMLLPRPELPPGEEMEDPRAALVAQLLEYKKFKKAAEKLAALEAEHSARFPAGGDGRFTAEDVTGESVFVLLAALREALARAPEQRDVVPRQHGPTVTDQMFFLRRELAEKGGRVRFSELFVGPRVVIIVTFLALLEMLKNGECRVRQDAPFGEIWIYATVKAK